MNHKKILKPENSANSNQPELGNHQGTDLSDEECNSGEREGVENSPEYQGTLLEALTESVLDGILIISPEGQILHFNQKFLDIWNFPREVLEPKSDDAALQWAARQTSDPAAFLVRVKDIYKHSDQAVREEVLMKDGRVYERFGASIKSGTTLHGWVWSFRDITERKHQELRAQFLSELSRATQILDDPDEIMAVTAQMLGEHLGVNRCAYAEVEADEDHFIITGDYTQDTFSIIGRYAMSAFGAEVLRLMREDRPYVVDDVDSDLRISEVDLAAYRQTDIMAVICLPLHKGGRFAAAMAVHQKSPRHWTPAEIELVQTVVARCWEALERARALRDLRESEARYRALVEAGSTAVWRTDKEGRLLWINETFKQLSSLTLETAQGEDWLEVIHPGDRLQAAEAWQHAVATTTPYDVEHHVRGSDGQYRWVHSRAVPVFTKSGEVREWAGVDTDISERKEAEEAVRQSEEKFRGTFENAAVGIAHVGRDGTWLRVNQRLCDIVGYSEKELLQKSFRDITHPDDLETDLTLFQKMLQGEHESYKLEKRYLHKAGHVVWVLLSVSAIKTSGKVSYFISVVEDISARKRAEAALARFTHELEHCVEARTQQVRVLAGQLTLAEAREQARLAQVLHDDLQQQLFATQFALREVRQRVGENAEVLSKLEEANMLLKEAVVIARGTTANLSPPVLRGEGLLEALLWLSSDMKGRYALEVRIEAPIALNIPSEPVRVMLFNLLRELLFNVAKHAEVGAASVVLAEHEDRLELKVSDLGKGFNPALIRQEGHGTGLGLSGVDKRLQLFGGQLRIDSAPGKGTCVSITLPTTSLNLT